MEIDKELVETIIELLNAAFNAECDAFGILHNTATDVIGELEVLLVE